MGAFLGCICFGCITQIENNIIDKSYKNAYTILNH